ncbi:MAG: hypothetical protein F6K28_47555 [Microcoleus sp. SIO2G3]|nr:hypothetical protein [Microcoleus sp. SIO2G3]
MLICCGWLSGGNSLLQKCDRFEHFFDRPWQVSEPRQTRLVLIGRALDQEQIQDVLCSV